MYVHDTPAQRVILEPGGSAEHLAAEIARLGGRRVMLVGSPRITIKADFSLRWTEITQHVPVELATRARAAAAEARVDLIVAVGGGSAIGLAKAIALTSRVPIIAVPTTYAGSEATAVWGLTEGGTKTTGVDPGVLPVTVIYDPVLTVSMPVELSVASGLNGLAHCVDAMWAPNADPINQAYALEGMRVLGEALPVVAADPADLDGREQCQTGAYLSAVAFASAGSGLHHKICHVLGGAYDLPHAPTHAVVLPYVLSLNAPAVPRVAHRIARSLGADTAQAGLDRLRDQTGAPRSLRDLGLAETDIPDAAGRILAVVPPSNPAPVTLETLKALLYAAWAGDSPEAPDEH